jgi:hypothetical protein
MENVDPIKRGFEWSIWGGVRLGGAYKINPEVELENAVALAARSDGARVFSLIIIRAPDTNFVSSCCACGWP